MNMCAPASVSLSIPGHWLDRTSLQFPVSRAPCMSLCPPAPSHHPNSALHAQPAPHQSTLCAGALMTAAKAEKAGAQSHLGPLPLHPQTGGGGKLQSIYLIYVLHQIVNFIFGLHVCVCVCVCCVRLCVYSVSPKPGIVTVTYQELNERQLNKNIFRDAFVSTELSPHLNHRHKTQESSLPLGLAV